MNENGWDRFIETGNIYHYLNYKYGSELIGLRFDEKKIPDMEIGDINGDFKNRGGNSFVGSSR